MAEGKNFFDDCSPQICIASSSAEHKFPGIPPCDEDFHDHDLELCLGFISEEKPKQKLLRPVPVYPNLGKQRSENVPTALGNGDLLGAQATAAADKALFSRTRWGSAFSIPRISREDVWQTLQKANAVLGGEMVSKPLTVAASPMWSKRSTSMQGTILSHDVGEVIPHAIRRSSSNSIPQGHIPCHGSLKSELFMDGGVADALSDAHQRHEALELQRKREIQAHRRLEARKRRRFQSQEKQQKKGLQCQNSKQCISPTEESPQRQNSQWYISYTTENSLHVCSPFLDETTDTGAKAEVGSQSEGVRASKVTVREVASMVATPASSYSESKSTRSKKDNQEVGSRLEFEPESPSQKGAGTANGVLGFKSSVEKSSGTTSLIAKKSVGVFSEGKWKAINEVSEASSIRRTASNINKAVLEPPSSLQQLPYHDGYQRSFGDTADEESKAGGLLRNVKQEPEVSWAEGTVVPYDSFSQMVKPILHQSGLIQNTASTTHRRKVKEEMVELCDGDVEALQVNLAGIDRQRSCSLPQLPWVSATGKGPNGKTINGVMYILDGSVHLVCRCHGKHMSPVEFVEHSGSSDLSNPLRNIMVNAFGTFFSI